MIKKAKKEGGRRGVFVIAKSKKLEPGSDGAIGLLFQGDGEADVVLPYEAGKDALTKKALEAVLEKELVGALVAL